MPARAVAFRRQGPHLLLKVDAAAVQAEGFSFFTADNGVWLAHEVPPAYLTVISETA
jgi:putative RNA 2'-phosphotransferase